MAVRILNNSNMNTFGPAVTKMYNDFRQGEKPVFDVFIRRLINKNYRIWVSHDGILKTGFIIVNVTNLRTPDAIMSIDLVYVEPRYRKNGYAIDLLIRALNYAKKYKIKTVELYCDAKSDFLVKMYQSLGFVTVKRSSTTVRMVKNFNKR